MKKAIIGLINIYRAGRYMFPVSCKFIPSCSEYALIALEKHPVRTALKLIGRRLLRCHPFSRGGIDLVP